MSKDIGLLGESGLKDRTRGIDIVYTFKGVVEKFELDFKLASFVTYGAPALIGRKPGFVSLPKP